MYGFFDGRHVSTALAPSRYIDTCYNFFNPSFLFFSGDTSYINATRQAGVFPYALAVLLPVGLYAVLSARRMRMAETLLLGFFLAPIAAVLVAEVKINRALVVMPFGALIAVAGWPGCCAAAVCGNWPPSPSSFRCRFSFAGSTSTT